MSKVFFRLLILCVCSSLLDCTQKPAATLPQELVGWWVRVDQKTSSSKTKVGFSFYSDGRIFLLERADGPGLVDESGPPLPIVVDKNQICWISQDEEGNGEMRICTDLRIDADGKSIEIAKGPDHWAGGALPIGRLVKYSPER